MTCDVGGLNRRGQGLGQIMIACFMGLQGKQARVGEVQEPEGPISIGLLISQESTVCE